MTTRFPAAPFRRDTASASCVAAALMETLPLTVYTIPPYSCVVLPSIVPGSIAASAAAAARKVERVKS